MSAYTDGIAAKVREMLDIDGEALVSGKTIGAESAANIAVAIGCECAYRYGDDYFEFSRDAIAAEHPRDMILSGETWEAAQ